jgi:diguanylate cyclase (GGDEF)-like protein/putative nucleotidyltransferase with HDIG domain
MRFTVPHRIENGETRQVDVYACPIRYDGRELLCSIIFDVTGREETYREVAYLGYHDYLTGLYNRRYFDEALQSFDKPENLPLCILMADMNSLKMVNEIFGHEAGDKALIRAAAQLKEAAGPTGVGARIGGDEFALIIPHMREPDVLEMLGNLKKLEADEKEDEVPVSISIGYQLKISADENILDVLTEAEKYLFRHKIYESASLRNLSIDLVMNALCEKSAREREHSSRTSYLAEEIARLLGMSEPQLYEIRIAGLLHDIGKIGIPESVLNKPGRLVDDELNILKKHSEIGWRILGSSVDYKEIAKIVLHQHERWDGKGYPGGLAGEDIPLQSRIIAVADAYDVMREQAVLAPAQREVAAGARGTEKKCRQPI